MADTLKDASRKEWACLGELATHEELQTGCLQRIADATELMAKSYRGLIEERDFYKRWWKKEEANANSLSRRNAALRGVITKMKGRS